MSRTVCEGGVVGGREVVLSVGPVRPPALFRRRASVVPAVLHTVVVSPFPALALLAPSVLVTPSRSGALLLALAVPLPPFLLLFCSGRPVGAHVGPARWRQEAQRLLQDKLKGSEAEIM